MNRMKNKRKEVKEATSLTVRLGTKVHPRETHLEEKGLSSHLLHTNVISMCVSRQNNSCDGQSNIEAL